jgi:membrane protein
VVSVPSLPERRPLGAEKTRVVRFAVSPAMLIQLILVLACLWSRPPIAVQISKQGFLAAGLGLLVLLFGATGVFVELRDALNLIWKVPDSGGVLRGLLKGRLLAFNIVVGTGFILIVSLLVSTALAMLADSFGSHLNGLDDVMRGLDFGVSCAVIATLFALIFKVLPDVPLSWRDVWLGAVVTSLLFTAGKFAIGAYLGTTRIASAYGAAGSVVLLLLWVYYSSLIFFFGAELTRSYAYRYGSMAAPQG